MATELKKGLGVFELAATGIGIILGAGIYVIIGATAGLAGGAIWVPFGLAALAAALTGMSYAELASMYPKAGASYEYARNAFGPRPAFTVGWLMLFANVISAAAVALGFGGYLFGFTGAPVLVVSLALVAVCTLLLVWGVKETVWVGVAFTAAEVLGLLIVIFVAARFIGGVDYLEAPSGVQGLLQATLLIFFAYLGFDQIANLSEETRNPGKVVPAAILIAIGVTTVLYVAVAVSSVSVLGWQALSESGAPLADVVEAATGARASVVISVIALFATANTVLFLLLTASRMAYGMGSTGAFPRVIARIHPSRKTPWVATLAVSGIAGVVVLVQDITAIAEVTNVAVLAAFVGVNASLIRLRRKAPDAARGFRVPLSVLGVPAPTALAIVLSVIMIANTGLNALLIGVVLVAVGIAIPLLTPAPRSEPG